MELAKLKEAGNLLAEVLRQYQPFPLTYRGFLLTPDGTLIVRGYGAFDGLRQELRTRLPFASQQQSSLGHVSLGRILDPVGEKCFEQLKLMMEEEERTTYGQLQVNEATEVRS